VTPNYLVLGAGMMGRAAAYDLAQFDPSARVVIADINAEAADIAVRTAGPNVRPLLLDVNADGALAKALAGMDVVISAVSYSINERLTHAAIDAGVHMCDMGGNNDVVDRQLALDGHAQTAGVTIVPNCGLAPGLINMLGMDGVRAFDAVESVKLRVGGLPLHPRPPLQYQIVFSVEGLINEYVEPAEVIRGGRRVTVPSMADLESLSFPEPFTALEAFNTSGGLSILPRLLEGTVAELDYKTIRYPGHCEKMRTLLDLGFASHEPIMIGNSVRTSRELFTELLRRKLDTGGPDVILARSSVTGTKGGARACLVSEFVDYYDEATGMSAMMRTTAYPTSIIAQQLAHGLITRRGVLTPEVCAPAADMVEQLARRGITISTTLTEEKGA
jgi:lysine 6-dehydrogenase